MHRLVGVQICVLGAVVASAQPVLHLKARSANSTLLAAPQLSIENRKLTPDRHHRMIQFAQPLTGQQVQSLEANAGLRVLQYVPDHALLVSAPDGFAPVGSNWWSEALTAADKWSPELDRPLPAIATELTKDGEEARRTVLVEFYPDVRNEEARQIAGQEKTRVLEHADLLGHHLLVEGSEAQLRHLTEWDEVAYVSPASMDLRGGRRVHVCGGAVTAAGAVGQYISKVGEGWDGPGKKAARLRYLIGALTAKVPAEEARAEIKRALAEWSRVAQIDFAEGGAAGDAMSLHITFAKGAHGDPYPFDGAGRVLAHTFYPAPPNPEPLAGDLHLDEEEAWRVGTDIDLYSVVLHELGHALGLAHSDKPGAVMYAYYQRASSLTDEDISAVLELYAARSASPPTPPSEPTPPEPTPSPSPNPTPPPASPPSPATDRTAPALTVAVPHTTSVTTTAASLAMRGSASDNVGVSRVIWTSNVYGTGTATGTTGWSATVPLALGYNTIVVRAYDAAGNSSWRSLVVTRK